MARKKRNRKDEPEGSGGAAGGAPQPTRLTPVDVQQKVFRLAFRGYREADVDQFLDQVTETLAILHEENKRLQEALESGTGAAPGSAAGAERQAAEIVRQAREHAARLVGEADRRAHGGPQTAVPVSTSFLVRERAFLQRLASLVQSHARSLKDEARRAGEASLSASAPPAGVADPAGQPEDSGAQPPVTGDVTATATEAPQPPSEGEAGPSAEEPEQPEQPEERASGGQPNASPEIPPSPPVEPAPSSAVEATGPPPAEPEGPPGDADAPPEARAFSTEAPAQEEAPTVPWRPVESESPAEAGWSVEGSGEEGDPLLSAWESAFLARPEEDQPEDRGSPPEPRGEEGERDSQEPSLRELFWGEE